MKTKNEDLKSQLEVTEKSLAESLRNAKNFSEDKLQQLEKENKKLKMECDEMNMSLANDTRSLHKAKNLSDERIQLWEKENYQLKTKGDDLLRQIKASLDKESRLEKKEKDSECKLKELTIEMERLKTTLDKKDTDVAQTTTEKEIRQVKESDSVEVEGDGEYDDDSFEDVSSKADSTISYNTTKNDDNSISECLSEIDGEMCDESVADIESDDDDDEVSVKSGLFFGGSAKKPADNENPEVVVTPIVNETNIVSDDTKASSKDNGSSKTKNTSFDMPSLSSKSPTQNINNKISPKKSKNKIVTAADIFGKSPAHNDDEIDDNLNDDIDAILGCL